MKETNWTPNEIAIFRALADGTVVPAFVYSGLVPKPRRELLGAMLRVGQVSKEEFEALAYAHGCNPDEDRDSINAVFNGNHPTPTVRELALQSLHIRIANMKDPKDLDELQRILDSVQASDDGVELSDTPRKSTLGLPIDRLPGLTKVTGGIKKIWLIGGKPGQGKTILALQIALLLMSQYRLPIRFFDTDCNGVEELEGRIFTILQENLEHYQKIKTRMKIYRSIASIETLQNSEPSVVVVDSIQKVDWKPGRRRDDLDFALKRVQHSIGDKHLGILVSEIPNDAFDDNREPDMTMFKETGQLGYTAQTAIVLRSVDPKNPLSDVVAHVVKNKTIPPGSKAWLVRNLDKVFWFESPVERISMPIQHDKAAVEGL